MKLALCFQPPVKTHALSETLHVWSLSEEPPLGRVRVVLSFSNVIDVVPEWNSDLWVHTLETLNKLNKVRIHFILFISCLTCSLQQDGAEAQADPGPAGPDPDAEEPRQRDQGGEAAAEQRRAEAAAAGGPECGVHSRAANPHKRHQGGWRRWRRRSPALEQNFTLCSFPLSQEAKEQLSPLSAALEKLQKEKQELADRQRQKREEGQEKVETTWMCHNGIHLNMQENCQGNNPNPNNPNYQTLTTHTTQNTLTTPTLTTHTTPSLTILTALTTQTTITLNYPNS